MSLLITGARLVGSTAVTDLLLDGGRIARIEPEIPRAAGITRIIEADGRWAAPGLWDAHVHPTDWATAAHRLDLSSATTPAECVHAVESRVARGDTEVIATGLWCATWPEQPTRADLDHIRRPVALVSGDIHSAVLNAAALDLYRLHEVADPDGWVREASWFALMPDLGAVDEATRDRWVIEAGQAAAARGVVGIVDLDPGDVHQAWRRRVAAGFASHRVRACVWTPFLEPAIEAGLRTGDPIPGAGPLVSMGPLKIIADGSLNTGTAFCHAPFPDGAHGAMNLPADELADHLARALAGSIDAAIHAIGDAALESVLDAFEATGARGRIEHVQLAPLTAARRMRTLGLTASVQPMHLVADRDVADVLWAGRTDRAYAFADLVRAAVPLALGSDAPVAPLDPWLAIQAAVTRTGDDRPPWHPEQRIGVATALAASTDGVETLRPHGPADVVLLESDPLQTPPQRLGATRVAATICAGHLTHDAL